jgi:SAM-dependent methyltransferase
VAFLRHWRFKQMTDYGFLVLPSHNRVYSRSALQLVRSELQVFSEAAMEGRIRDIEERLIGGVPYVTFSADELTDQDGVLLSNLSSLYALYRIDGECLTPVQVRPLDKFGSDLLTIQKYSGKTNEDFTKLLLNVTAMVSDSPADLTTRRLRVLDPMCGRGTTLNQAMMYGFDASGVDVDAKDFESYSTFIRTWLKNNRIKHQAETTNVRRDGATLGRRLHIVLGESKELYKKGEVIEITVVNSDTLQSDKFFRPASFDLIVTDAPYGVQHGSRPKGGKGKATLSRSPVQLLEAAIPVWARLLRPGGAIGISWNTYVARREDIADILDANGFQVPDSETYQSFRHRVDQAIIRDLIVARRRSATG